MLKNLLKNIAGWYFSSKTLPYWCVLMIDCVIIMFSGILGMYVDFGGSYLASHFWPCTLGLLITLIPMLVFFKLFHTYSGIIRYSSFVDLQRVAIANVCGILTAYLLGILLSMIPWFAANTCFPKLIGSFVLFCCATLLMWFERVLVKRIFDTFNIDSAIPVAIYGTKAGGISVAKSLNSVREKKYNLKLFISDGIEMKNTYLMGKKVYLNGEGIAATLLEQGVKVLLVSPLKTEKFRSNEQMVDEIIGAGIKIMMMTGEEEWDGKSPLSHDQLHEVDIEDLLPRDKIEVDMDAIGSLLKGRRILITGAAGSIGRARRVPARHEWLTTSSSMQRPSSAATS